jgi:transcriptional regulator with XRE-family HTH domain
MKTEVRSLAHDPDRQAVREAKAAGRYVYIGRIHYQRPKGQRDWGNYAPDGKVEKNRPDQHAEHLRAVEAFRQWVKSQPNLITSVAELRGKVLVCHCKGLPCHGHVLKELADAPAKRGRPVSEVGASQRQLADELGVSLRTIQRWEKTRQIIASDPELSAKATTPEGLQEAKKLLIKRNADQYAPEKAAKAILSAINKWESLRPEDAEITRDILMQTDFIDRIVALAQSNTQDTD